MTYGTGTRADLLGRQLALWLLSVLLIACGGGTKSSGDPSPGETGDGDTSSLGDGGQSDDGQDGADDPLVVTDADRAHPQGWFGSNTIAHRVDLPLAARGATLHAQELVNQLAGYDPGSLLRCAVADNAAYRAAIDAIGGVTWGYGVSVLEDLSKPRFQAGLLRYQPFRGVPGATDAAGAAPPVEIVKPDIVAVTEDAALFYSSSHGLMLVDLTGSEPAFKCAIQLPGVVDQFFFHDGHLVAMVKQQPALGLGSFLVHLDVDATTLGFVETVNLGAVNILDSRRFNDKLVFYTDLSLHPVAPVATQNPGPFGGVAPPVNNTYASASHRSLRVFTLGETLVEEMHDTLIDTTVAEDQLINTGVAPDTQLGDVVYESRQFGSNMWASDHYFAVTESITATRFDGWRTQTYSVCTESHVQEMPYEHCTTLYETRANPNYRPPDNSAGDHACTGITLSECLREVAGVASETIEVPVGRECVERVRQNWICDRSEQQMVEYPTFRYDQRTQLYIYEYNPSGFVRLDTSVHEITTQGLDALHLEDSVPVLTTSAETFDLAVPGAVQTLHFQNGILYVISEGVLQVYTLSGSSLVRTATLQVVNDSLQSSLFSDDQLFLSDFGYNLGMDQSTLRVVNLSNPAFPRIDGSTHSLPGGHSTILASRYGILTIGAVNRFEGQTINAIKLGLFSDPYAAEEAYLILATDLDNTWLAGPDSHYFSGTHQRLLLPYLGQDGPSLQEQRVSVSRVMPGEIVSEGAVHVPEAVQRVRSVDATEEAFLTFAENSIEWLTPAGSEWQSTAVLEYFQPFALLRLNETDDYVEVQRLGDRCKLFFANASRINQREAGITSAEFVCPAQAQGLRAYNRTLLLSESAVEFDDEGTLRELSAAERSTIEAAIAERQTCLLSLDLVDDLGVDYEATHSRDDFTCVGPIELQRLTQEANGLQP